MSQAKPQKLSTRKWILGIVALLVVAASGALLGLWLRSRMYGPIPTADEYFGGHSFAVVVLGIVTLFLGCCGYVLVLFTHCFTFDFQRPFFPSLSGKLRIANFVVGFAIISGIALMLAPTAARILGRVLSGDILVPVAVLLPFFLMQLFFMWLDMWAPLQPSMIRERLRCFGFAPDQIDSGIPIGISDPDIKRHFGLVEDDVGMLWLTPRMLVYRGDTRWFDIRPEQLVAMERKASGRCTSAYFGAVHIVLRYVEPDGMQRAVMLHPENVWTMTGVARSLNRLAARIEEWRRETARTGSSLPAPSLRAPAH